MPFLLLLPILLLWVVCSHLERLAKLHLLLVHKSTWPKRVTRVVLLVVLVLKAPLVIMFALVLVKEVCICVLSLTILGGGSGGHNAASNCGFGGVSGNLGLAQAGFCGHTGTGDGFCPGWRNYHTITGVTKTIPATGGTITVSGTGFAAGTSARLVAVASQNSSSTTVPTFTTKNFISGSQIDLVYPAGTPGNVCSFYDF